MSIQGTSIALVDDDALFRDSLASLLELSGLTVEQYDCGEEFLGAAATSEVACVVADIQLGDITGIEMARQLAELDFRFPIILITGSNDPVFERQAQELGAAFLKKPFRRDTLIEAIMAATAPLSEKQGR